MDGKEHPLQNVVALEQQAVGDFSADRVDHHRVVAGPVSKPNDIAWNKRLGHDSIHIQLNEVESEPLPLKLIVGVEPQTQNLRRTGSTVPIFVHGDSHRWTTASKLYDITRNPLL